MKPARLFCAILFCAALAFGEEPPTPKNTANKLDKEALKTTAEEVATQLKDAIVDNLGTAARVIDGVLLGSDAQAPRLGETPTRGPSDFEQFVFALPLGRAVEVVKGALKSTELGKGDDYPAGSLPDDPTALKKAYQRANPYSWSVTNVPKASETPSAKPEPPKAPDTIVAPGTPPPAIHIPESIAPRAREAAPAVSIPESIPARAREAAPAASIPQSIPARSEGGGRSGGGGGGGGGSSGGNRGADRATGNSGRH